MAVFYELEANCSVGFTTGDNRCLMWHEPLVIIFITVAIIIGNIIVLLVIYKTESLKTHASGYFMMSLACADLGVGTLVTPLSIYPSITHLWPYGNFVCKLQCYLGTAFCCVSILTLTFVSIERYIFISKPLEYHTIVTEKRGKITIGIIWIVAIVACSGPVIGVGKEKWYDDYYLCLLDWDYNIYYSATIGCLIILPSFIIIAFAYVKILVISRRQARQIQDAGHQISAGRRKGVGLIIVVIIAFYIAWIPWLIMTIQEDVGFAQHLQENTELNVTVILNQTESAEFHPHPKEAHFMTMWLAFCNSFWNCIIYSALKRDFRKGLKHVFCRSLVANTSNTVMGETSWGGRLNDPPVPAPIPEKVYVRSIECSSPESDTGRADRQQVNEGPKNLKIIPLM